MAKRHAAHDDTADAGTESNEPWNEENDPNHPMRRGVLGIAKKRKGFIARWVTEASVDARKVRGYVLAKPEDYGMEGTDGRIKRNEMVLMEIPEDKYEAGRAAVAKQTDMQSRAAQDEFRHERAKASRVSGTDLSDERGE